MSVDELKHRLSAARERLEIATRALTARAPVGPDPRQRSEEFQAAYAMVLQLERELAEKNGQEHAVPLDFPVRWDTGAPMPHLLQNDYRTFLTFYLREDEPGWDGSYVQVVQPGSGRAEELALVEFVGCISARLGSPNDEVLAGHPLHGRGLQGYTAQQVVNSRWLAELEKINSVHQNYNPDRWRRRQHYILWFHDTTFECIADSFRVELHRSSMADLLALVCDRLLG